MNVTIIGSGSMAEAIGTHIVAGGHDVTILNRDEEKAGVLASKLGKNVKFGGLKSPMEGEVVILALPYNAIFDVAEKFKNDLNGKIVVDICNPVDFQTFELLPPTDSSGAEEIAKKLPDSKLVKAFNTTFYKTLIKGEVDGKKLDIFIASDDKEVGETVAKLADDGGLRGLYVGPLERARFLEGFMLIQMTLQEKLKTNWQSAIKILP